MGKYWYIEEKYARRFERYATFVVLLVASFSANADTSILEQRHRDEEVPQRRQTLDWPSDNYRIFSFFP